MQTAGPIGQQYGSIASSNGSTCPTRSGRSISDAPSTTIDLSTWAGSGEGMIGGPTRTQIADFLYCGVLERGFPPYDPTKLRREIASFEEWLDDERYELAPDVRDRVESYIAKGRLLLGQVR